MALTKIGKEGITGVSNAANATFLTATSAEGVTLAGTLAVTGVHTVGTNAVATSEGGAETTSIVQGLCKWWVRHQGSATLLDSFNNASITDNGTGDFSHGFTNDFRADNVYAVSGIAEAKNSRTCKVTFMLAGGVTEDGLIRYETGFQSHLNGDSTAHDCDHTHVLAHGDLA